MAHGQMVQQFVEEGVGLMPLELKLVEIIGQAPVSPTPKMLEFNPNCQIMEVNGQKGQALMWVVEESKYLVETFDGLFVCINEEDLIEYMPKPGEEGGIDAILSQHMMTREGPVGAVIASTLLDKGFCIAQTTMSPKRRKAALEAAEARSSWVNIMEEFASAYMGKNTQGKVSWLVGDGGDDLDDLVMADAMLSTLCLDLVDFAPQFGFASGFRSNGMVRMLGNAENATSIVENGQEDDRIVDVNTVRDNLAFVQRRKISVLYLLRGSTANLKIHPHDGSADFEIAMQENRLIVYCNDMVDITFDILDNDSVALQTWIIRDAYEGESGLELDDKPFMDSAMPTAPAYGQSGESVECMSFNTSFGGNVSCGDTYWNVLVTGCDTLKLMTERWDWEAYYAADATPGKLYIKHYSGLGHDIHLFDNDMFGMTKETAAMIEGSSRVLLEKSYTCLSIAGWTMETLNRTDMPVVVASMGSGEYFQAGNDTVDKYEKGLMQEKAFVSVPTRVGFVFGLRGMAVGLETACSSSLTATCVGHNLLRPLEPEGQMPNSCFKQYKSVLVGAHGANYLPFYTISLCGAGMLSHAGRCFTFDASADGFARAEGVSALHLQVQYEQNSLSYARVVGTACNQDGRSASLTAPHGPSQQECIRASLREAQIVPTCIQIQELHGTGTALGDPIEVGALRATMMTHDRVVRDHPLVKTSSKSNVAHMEMNAGIGGIMKCILMSCYCVACPNVHLRILNPHIDSHAYPVLFTSDLMDQGKSSGFFGVSSFGFGGSNARGDIWGWAQAGILKPKNAPKFTATHSRLGRRTNCPGAGEGGVETNGSTCLEGGYWTGSPFGEFALCIQGTWDGWATSNMMVDNSEGVRQWSFRLGDTKIEEFKINCEHSSGLCIFPDRIRAGPDALILGPGLAPTGHSWVVDMRDDTSTPVGTTFVISFWWDSEAKAKRISWEPAGDKVSLPPAQEPKHFYQVMGSWTAWTLADMRPVDGEDGSWEIACKIGATGEELFQVVRDRDRRQVIYPTQTTASALTVPVRGPDHNNKGKYWVLQGRAGDESTIRVKVVEGDIVVTIRDGRMVRTFRKPPGKFDGYYWLTGSFNDWGFMPMAVRPANPGIYTASLTMKDDRTVFKIVVDKDFDQALHPEMDMAPCGISRTLGPHAHGQECNWLISAPSGSTVEIRLSFLEHDERRIITWKVGE